MFVDALVEDAEKYCREKRCCCEAECERDNLGDEGWWIVAEQAGNEDRECCGDSSSHEFRALRDGWRDDTLEQIMRYGSNKL